MVTSNNGQNGRVRDERISHIQQDIKEYRRENAILAKEIYALKVEHARISERMTLFQVGQGFFTVIATGIAAYLALQ